MIDDDKMSTILFLNILLGPKINILKGAGCLRSAQPNETFDSYS